MCINIQDKEGVLSAEQINAILTGIAEMTDSVEQQRYFLETIIEREFKDGAKGKTNDQLKAIAKKESERILQKQVDEMKAEHKELKESFDGMQQQFNQHKEDTSLRSLRTVALNIRMRKKMSENNAIKMNLCPPPH